MRLGALQGIIFNYIQKPWRFRLYLSQNSENIYGNASVTNSRDVTFDELSYDPSNSNSTSNHNGFICSEPGYYLIIAKVAVPFIGLTLRADVWKVDTYFTNTLLFKTTNRTNTTLNNYIGCTGMDVQYLNVGDLVYVNMNFTFPSTTTSTVQDTWLTCTFLSH